MRRELWEMIVEMADAIMPLGTASQVLHVTDLSLDMPIEVEVRPTAQGYTVRADVPRWRLASGFEPPRGRLRLAFHEGESHE
jgi:hypothetical protein